MNFSNQEEGTFESQSDSGGTGDESSGGAGDESSSTCSDWEASETTSESRGAISESETESSYSNNVLSSTYSSASSDSSESSLGSSQSSSGEVVAQGGLSQTAWEMCCSPSSTLTTMVRRYGLQAQRLTLPQFDFSMPRSGAKAAELLEAKRPTWVWVSTPCTAWSPFQNMRKNKSSKSSKKALRAKRRYSSKIVRNTLRSCRKTVLAGTTSGSPVIYV